MVVEADNACVDPLDAVMVVEADNACVDPLDAVMVVETGNTGVDPLDARSTYRVKKTTMASLEASEDFDNPWESAANDERYRSTSLRVEERVEAAVEAAAASPDEQEGMSLKNRLIWWNSLWDGFLSSLFIIFSFFLYHKHQADDSNNTTQMDLLTITLLILFMALALILLLRSILGKKLLHFNMNSRPILVLIYLVTAAVLFADTKHLPQWVLKLEQGKKEVLPLVLLSLALLEVVFFCVLRHCHLSELEDIQDAENLQRYTTQSGGSPWWWNNTTRGRRANGQDGDENLEEPLLFGQPSWTNRSNNRYRVRDGVESSSSSSWWPSPNAREDGSVDYASLNEDWASRSEADPYWWSRDDDGN